MMASSRARLLSILGDLFGLALVGVFLAVIHFYLPASLETGYVFRQSLTRPETLLTAAYLHVDDEHMIGNLVGYGAVALYTYVLCLGAGQRRWFRFTTVAMLTVVPVLVNLTSMVVWRATLPGVDIPPSQGFSGVVAGFGGFLAMALLVSLRQVYSRRTVRFVGQFLLLVVLGALLVIYAGSPPVFGLALVAGAIVLVGVGIVRNGHPDSVPDDRDEWLNLVAALVEIGLVMVLLSVLVRGLFPVDIVDDGSVTNVYAHLSGLVWGVIVSRWGYRYWEVV